MALETVSNLNDLLKEVWTQNRLEKQFYNEFRWLDKVTRTNKYTIGRQAQVPVEGSLPGGESTFGPAGGTLNDSDALHVDRAEYTIQYLYQQVGLQVAAMAQADSVGARSTVDAVDQTIESNVFAMRRSAIRQAFGNQDALIAECDTTTAATEVELLSTGFGFDAIVRGWLRPGQVVDIGTAADEDSVTGAGTPVTITGVEEDEDTPSITVDTAVTTATGDFVSIADARSGTSSNETNGLRNIVGSTGTTLGNIDPTTAGNEHWEPALVDSTTTQVSLNLLLELQRRIYQKTGRYPSYVLTSPKQCAELYSLYQNQVRFEGDSSTEAGNVDGFKWNGMSVKPDPDCPDRELYMLNLDDFLIVTGGDFSKPTWMSDIEGSGGRLRWNQGTTQFKDALVYPLQIAVKRRNSHAAAVSLTA